MARYVEVDALKATIKANDWSNPAVPNVVNMIIDRLPTADVAPRSEVEALEKEIDRLKKILDYYALQYGTVKSQQQVIDRAKSEVAREIFGEIEAQINALEYNARTPRKTVSVDELKAQMDWVLREVIPGTLAKIKQKYTEGEDGKM